MKLMLHIGAGTPHNHPALRTVLGMALGAVAIDRDNEHWAELDLNGDDEALLHVLMRCDASSEALALRVVSEVFEGVKGLGLKTFVRNKPEARTDHDFLTELKSHQGYVRFSVSNEPGELVTRFDADGCLPLLYVGGPLVIGKLDEKQLEAACQSPPPKSGD